MADFCSRGAPLLRAVNDLSRGALGVLRQHLHSGAAALCQRLTVSQFGIAALKGGGRLWLIGVDTLKAQLFNRLLRGSSVRFSQSLESSFYEQLASERRVVRYSRGQPVRRFERFSGRAKAEALDCLIYATAARSAISIQPDAREADLLQMKQVTMPSVIRSNWMTR